MKNDKPLPNLNEIVGIYHSGAMYRNDMIAFDSELVVERIAESFDFRLKIKTKHYDMDGALTQVDVDPSFVATAYAYLPKWGAYYLRLHEKKAFELIQVRIQEKTFACLGQLSFESDVEFYRKNFAGEASGATEVYI